jgi:ketosteroid isomerase-like protein
MNAEQNIETVKAIYEAFGRGDVDAILEQCTDDVNWAADAAIEVAPWHGVKHGKAEMPSFFAGIGQTGPVTEFTPLSFAGNDGGDVMVRVHGARDRQGRRDEPSPLLAGPRRQDRLLPRFGGHRARRFGAQRLSARPAGRAPRGLPRE